jgi:hypothetical protein
MRRSAAIMALGAVLWASATSAAAQNSRAGALAGSAGIPYDSHAERAGGSNAGPARAPALLENSQGFPPASSLMFSEADVGAVEKSLAAFASGTPEVEAGKPEPETVKPRMPNIYVSAIIDLKGGDWIVWANGYRISPRQQAPNFQVVAVRDDAAEIVVAGDQPARFRLHPAQTWRSAHHDVVEGIFP